MSLFLFLHLAWVERKWDFIQLRRLELPTFGTWVFICPHPAGAVFTGQTLAGMSCPREPPPLSQLIWAGLWCPEMQHSPCWGQAGLMGRSGNWKLSRILFLQVMVPRKMDQPQHAKMPQQTAGAVLFRVVDLLEMWFGEYFNVVEFRPAWGGARKRVLRVSSGLLSGLLSGLPSPLQQFLVHTCTHNARANHG